MKKLFFTLFATFGTIPVAFAQDDNYFGVGSDRLRSGDITMNDVPAGIAWVINTIIAMAGILSIVALIFFAVKMQIASGITGDTTSVDRAKKGMIASGIGFLITISAWFIMGRIVDILINVSK